MFASYSFLHSNFIFVGTLRHITVQKKIFRDGGEWSQTTYFLPNFFYLGFGPIFDLKCHFSRKLIFSRALILRFLNSHGSKTYPRVGFETFTRLSFFSDFGHFNLAASFLNPFWSFCHLKKSK